MYDEKGLPVWYYIHGTHGDTRGDVSTDLPATNTVLVGPTSGEPAREVDLSGKVVWEGPMNGTTTLMSHYAGKTSTGNYLLNYELDKTITNGSTKIDDQKLVEIKPSLDVVWSWNLFDHIPPSGNREELCHGNMLRSMRRRTSSITTAATSACSRSTARAATSSGASAARTTRPASARATSPTPPEAQFSDAHEPEWHADGTLLLYDNGGYAQGGGATTTYHSRVVEYKIDEAAKTATLT